MPEEEKVGGLVLSRDVNESIRYLVSPSDESIEIVVKVTQIRSKQQQVRLLSIAPRSVRILREEVEPET